MAKYITVLVIAAFACCENTYSQAPALKIPSFSGNVNDWGSLFTDAQKNQLDSACTIFAFKTNMPMAVITFGSENASKDNTDAFIQAADSIFFRNNNGGANLAIFLSKEFRVLSFKANTAANIDTSKLGDWKAKMQQIFTGSVQPYIPLLKDGKYAEALIATIGDVAVGVKKEF